ncbi:MAG: enoyl-CoA hydratase/isomerase family protein [Planctomycetes bacterium]|nr:enoyl-CoA hydratase/isomerase family protein [Planctomycetota bacterium]
MSAIQVEREGYLAVVTINRPEKLNALDHDTIGELQAQFEALSAEDGVGAIILTGAGEKAFVAGADIGGLVGQGVFRGKRNAQHGQSLTRAIERSPKPVIVAINGFALGGGLELSLACDLRFASDNAKLGLPEVSLGIIPGYGGTQRLPRLVGLGNALQLILTGDHIDAAEALRIGLVNGVFPQADLLDEVKKVAMRIVSRGPHAVALAKQAARRGTQMTLDEGLELEADLFGAISATEEMDEGLKAFLEKRKPAWLRK